MVEVEVIEDGSKQRALDTVAVKLGHSRVHAVDCAERETALTSKIDTRTRLRER